MKKLASLLIGLFSFLLGNAQNQAPQIILNDFEVDFGTDKLTLDFDLADAENDPTNLVFLFSEDAGQTFQRFTIDSLSASQPINNGNYKAVWNFGLAVADIVNTIVRIVPNDNQSASVCDLATQVDSNNLKNWITWLEGPRNYTVDEPRMEMVKDSISKVFSSLGYTSNTVNFTSGSFNGENIIGQQNGVFGDNKTIIFDAHFDAVPVSPGADDNASGIAAVLEAARILKQVEFAHQIEAIAFDLEENGLLGSRNYAANITTGKQIEGVVNFEMIGYFSTQPNSQNLPTGFGTLFPTQTASIIADSSRGNFITNVYNNTSSGLGSTFIQSASNCVPNLKVVGLEVPGNGSLAPDLRRSDHAPFWDKNIPALMLTDGADFRNQNYHTANDKKGTLNFGFMTEVVAASVATIANLAQISHGEALDINLGFVNTENHHHHNCKVEVYPNPTNNWLYLNLGDCPNGKLLLEVFDLEGRKQIQLYENYQTENLKIDVQRLKPQTYVLVIGGEEFQKSVVFVKE